MAMKQKLLLASTLLALSAIGCNKEDDAPPLTGGKGGNASLRVVTMHHTRMITDITVYIKYAAATMPMKFDDSARVQITPTDTVAIFTGLKTGRYFLYGSGNDPLISQAVTGGVPITISEEKEYKVLCPVSESGDH